MSGLERQLLEAARSEPVPDALRARMAHGLGLEVGVAALGGSTAAGTTAGNVAGTTAGNVAGATAGKMAGTTAGNVATPLFAKTGLWGALALGLAATAAWQATRSTSAAPSATVPREIAQAQAQAAPPAPLDPSAGVEPASEHTPEAAATAASDPAPASADNVSASRPASTREDGDALRAEVALLDRARQALQRRRSGQALALLDQHARRFAHGTLMPEAAALRIEALTQRGAYDQADAKTRQFVKTYPTHPLRGRVAKLVEPHAAAPPR